jgi:hypothetical protein
MVVGLQADFAKSLLLFSLGAFFLDILFEVFFLYFDCATRTRKTQNKHALALGVMRLRRIIETCIGSEKLQKLFCREKP